ncbi:hypothetical protein VULLAG_LOCUS21566 [Vulpes lagopus]
MREGSIEYCEYLRTRDCLKPKGRPSSIFVNVMLSSLRNQILRTRRDPLSNEQREMILECKEFLYDNYEGHLEQGWKYQVKN